MKRILAVLLAVSAIVTAADATGQTAYPERPIRIVVGFPPGGPTDIVARLLGQKFAEAWGKPVVIENVPGAAGNIGADRVVKAAPDGYTLGFSNHAAIVINPGLYKLPYDPVKDLAPISQVCVGPSILARHRIATATLAQRQDLAAVIHLCGAGAGEAYARRGLRLTDGQRCGDHDVRAYLERLDAMKRTFARLAAGG